MSAPGLRAIVLDFDGVILESVDLKTLAMRRLFADRPEHLPAILRYHSDNAGLSRYEKFQHFYATMFHEPLGGDEMVRLDRTFGEIVADEIDACAFVPGAVAFLQAHAAEFPIFIVSGTPEVELRGIVARRGLGRWLSGVYGSPRTKEQHLRAIAAQLQATTGALLMIGDGRQDFEAATATGARFIGRVLHGGASIFAPGTPVVADLTELAGRWADLCA